MKAHKSWGYAPYKQPFFETGDIYICRVAPDETEILKQASSLRSLTSIAHYPNTAISCCFIIVYMP